MMDTAEAAPEDSASERPTTAYMSSRVQDTHRPEWPHEKRTGAVNFSVGTDSRRGQRLLGGVASFGGRLKTTERWWWRRKGRLQKGGRPLPAPHTNFSLILSLYPLLPSLTTQPTPLSPLFLPFTLGGLSPLFLLQHLLSTHSQLFAHHRGERSADTEPSIPSRFSPQQISPELYCTSPNHPKSLFLAADKRVHFGSRVCHIHSPPSKWLPFTYSPVTPPANRVDSAYPSLFAHDHPYKRLLTA